jgi:hypothetical protein
MKDIEASCPMRVDVSAAINDGGLDGGSIELGNDAT